MGERAGRGRTGCAHPPGARRRRAPAWARFARNRRAGHAVPSRFRDGRTGRSGRRRTRDVSPDCHRVGCGWRALVHSDFAGAAAGCARSGACARRARNARRRTHDRRRLFAAEGAHALQRRRACRHARGAAEGRDRRGRGAAPVAARRPVHIPRRTRLRICARRIGRAPACRADHSGRERPRAAARSRALRAPFKRRADAAHAGMEAASERADTVGDGEVDVALARAPAGGGRLCRGEALRCERRSERRDAVHRSLDHRSVHRCDARNPDAAPEGCVGGGAWRFPAWRAQREIAEARDRDISARRAVADRRRGAVRNGARDRAPDGPAAPARVRAARPVQPVRLGARVFAEGPLQFSAARECRQAAGGRVWRARRELYARAG